MRDPAEATPELRSLTGLRWIAASLVFLYHLRNMRYFGGEPQLILSTIAGPGFTGVSMFFVLSGFVLTWTARPGFSARHFYRRRVARIVPLHLVALGIALVLAATLVPSIRSPGPVSVMANAVLISSWFPPWWQAGNPVSWSLVCEAFFYLCFPLLFARASRLRTRGLRTALIASVVLGAAVAIVSGTVPHAVRMSFVPAARLPEFVAGIALALLVRRGSLRAPHPLVAVAVLLAGWIPATLLPLPVSELGDAFTLPGYLVLVASLARVDIGGRRSPLARQALVRLGELSFGFYLVHLLAIQALESAVGVRHGPLASAALAVVALAVALGCAWVLNLAVERPARRAILREWAREA